VVSFDITEGIPYALSNPSSADTYQLSTVQYDVAVAGLPFFLAASDDSHSTVPQDPD
jgi:hypothetical protein